jgi:hypothetical protein
MEGWHRVSAAGAKAQKSCLSQHANPPQTLLRRVLFCAGDTLPFLANFRTALIFFCYFFCIKTKKVSRDSEVLTSHSMHQSKKKTRQIPANGIKPKRRKATSGSGKPITHFTVSATNCLVVAVRSAISLFVRSLFSSASFPSAVRISL